MKKTIYRVIACLAVVLCFLPQSALANGPVAAPWLSFDLSNLPADVVFADILIQIKPDDPKYSSVNTHNLVNTGLSSESEISLYDKEGFRSFTFHYKDSVSSIEVSKDNYYEWYQDGQMMGFKRVEFCKGTEYREFYTQLEDLLINYRTMKLAFLDDKGAIIYITEAFTLPEMSQRHVFLNHINFDYQTGNVDMDIYNNPWYFVGIIVYGFIALFYISLSVGIEVATAICFRFKRKKITMIAIVNGVSQTLMRIAYIIMPAPHLLCSIGIGSN